MFEPITLKRTVSTETAEPQNSDGSSRDRTASVKVTLPRTRPLTWSLGGTLLAVTTIGVLGTSCTTEPDTKDTANGQNQSLAAPSSAAPRGPIGSATQREGTITYYVVKGARFFDILVARMGNREHVVLGEVDDMCLDLPDQRDFDNNGTTDALVFHSTNCRGDVAPGLLFFVSGNSAFERTNSFRGHQPKVERWHGNWSVLTTSARYILEDGKAVLVEEVYPR